MQEGINQYKEYKTVSQLQLEVRSFLAYISGGSQDYRMVVDTRQKSVEITWSSPCYKTQRTGPSPAAESVYFDNEGKIWDLSPTSEGKG
jgi:hypothetical protein